MPARFQERLQRELDSADIREVLYRLARSVDRRKWHDILELSKPDTLYDYGAYRGDATGLVSWMSKRHEGVLRSSHVIGNIIVEFIADAALVESYVSSSQRTLHPTDHAVLLDVLTHARYIDEFVRSEGTWHLKTRTVLIDNTVMLPAKRDEVAGPWNVGRRDDTDVLWTERKRLGIN